MKYNQGHGSQVIDVSTDDDEYEPEPPPRQPAADGQEGQGRSQKLKRKLVHHKPHQHQHHASPPASTSGSSLGHVDEKKLRRIVFEEVSSAIKKEVTQKKVDLPDNIKDMTVGQLLDYVPAIANFIPGLSQASTAANIIGNAAQYLPAAASALGSIGHVAKSMFGKGEQTGTGSVDTDIAPGLVKDTPQSFKKIISPAIVQTLGDNEPFFHKEDLLKLVPARFRGRANQLLDYILQNPMNINWNVNGVLTVCGQQIPNSDISDIFPELYKFHPNLKVRGLIDLIQFLCSSGLGNLIRKSKYWFLIRKSNQKFNQVGDGLPDNIPWYYIGDE